MSRAYRISVSESVRRHVRVSDGIRTQLELLDVLPADAMCGLLANELSQRGFERDGDDMVRLDDDGVEIRVAVNGDNVGHVTVRLTRENDVDIEVERTRQVYRETEDEARKKLKDQVDQAVEKQTKSAEAELSAEVTEVLERKLRDLRREFDQNRQPGHRGGAQDPGAADRRGQGDQRRSRDRLADHQGPGVTRG